MLGYLGYGTRYLFIIMGQKLLVIDNRSRKLSKY